MVVRGFLIGTAEAVPGISGGTVALIVGIYKFLIDSISNFFLTLARLTGFKSKLQKSDLKIDWQKLGFIAIGMATGLVLMARLIEPLLENFRGVTLSFFGGLVLASVYYPLKLAGKVKALKFLWVAPGVAVGLVLSGEVFTWQIEVITPVAAAIAISALVLPGVSGSFLLLLLGAYESTITALNNLDLGYLLSFAGGALIGLVTVVFVVRWFLLHFPAPTYFFMAGLMLGTLPALFPELSEEFVDFHYALFAFAGIFLVLAFIAIEAKLKKSSQS